MTITAAIGLPAFADSQQLAAKAQLDLLEGEQLSGRVTASTGEVQFRNERTVLWTELRLNDTVSEGDRLRTGTDGQLKVEFTNGNVLFLKPNSEIYIDKLSIEPLTGKYETVIEAVTASLKAEVNDKKHMKTFQVKTPTIVAGVRGTILYVNAARNRTDVFVERGRAFLEKPNGGRDEELRDGFAVSVDRRGEVSKPFVPPPEKMEEYHAAWEPPPPAGSENPEGTSDPGAAPPTAAPPPAATPLPPNPPLPPLAGTNPLYPPLQNFFNPNQINQTQQAQFDRATTQVTNPPPPNANTLPPANDNDGDFLLNNEELGLGTNPLLRDTDNDGLSDWEEARIQSSNPLVADSDADGILDGNDLFPNNNTLSGTRVPIRTKRYGQISAIPGLRTQISTMLSDANERQKDYIMDRISDAQTHKVLKDHLGNWVRMEEYVFRPTPAEVDVQVITANSSAWTSMMWTTKFQNSLTGMTSTQIRDLPWEKFLAATPNYGATAPGNFPTSMEVVFEHDGSPDIFKDKRLFTAPSFSGAWTQTVTATDSINGSAYNIYTVIPGTPNTNPNNFQYSGTSGTAFFDIYITNDAGVPQGTAYTFGDLWSVLGANLTGFQSVGNNNIEINLSFNSHNWIVIYAPIRSLTYRGTTQWQEPLSW